MLFYIITIIWGFDSVFGASQAIKSLLFPLRPSALCELGGYEEYLESTQWHWPACRKTGSHLPMCQSSLPLNLSYSRLYSLSPLSFSLSSRIGVSGSSVCLRFASLSLTNQSISYILTFFLICLSFLVFCSSQLKPASWQSVERRTKNTNKI